MIQKCRSFLRLELPKSRIKVNEAELPAVIIWAMLIFIFFERIIVQTGAPGAIIYILDVCNIYLLVCLLYHRTKGSFLGLKATYFVILATSIPVAFLYYGEWGGNPVTTLVEARNVIRFLIFFLACVSFLRERHLKGIFLCLEAFFYVNGIYIIYQYLTYQDGTNMRGDHLNGFFGTATGGNIFVNVILIAVVVILFNKWNNGEIHFLRLIIPVAFSIGIAGMIELKAYFVEIVIIYIWYLFRKKKKYLEVFLNIVLIIALIVIAYVALQYMLMEYPWFREAMSLQGMLASVTDTGGYTGNGDLNRFTGIITISETIFEGDLAQILFGIGLGNGAISNMIGDTPIFAALYAENHYSWFSNTYVFVQGGLISVGAYLFTFIYLLFIRKTNEKYRFLTEVMAIISIFLFFYGEALKTDIGYFVYLLFACGFIAIEKKSDSAGIVEE